MDNLNKPIVYITGAGPGDPNLLTLKAKEVLEKAEVILYDNLVSQEVIELTLFLNPEVRLIYAGRVGYCEEKSVNIEKVCNLLFNLAKEHKIICRLKGGDPNVFGRLGEEAVFLKEKGINFEIIPGVSSITSVSAYSGIPLTHRDCASSFTVLTASGNLDNPENKIRWENFDAINGTLVILMGTKKLPKIINKLLELGRKEDTKVAIIEAGTTSSQKTHLTTLGEAYNFLNTARIKTPSLTIIGEVVKLREILNWFETKPLFGKKVLITRSNEQSISFASNLIKCGAKPISCPIVSYKIIEKEIYNKNIINNLSNYDWIFFTSQNSVRFFFEILKKNYYDSRALYKTKIAVLGYRTKLELEKYNLKPDFIPKKFSFVNLTEELNEVENLKQRKILWPTQAGSYHKTNLQNIIKWEIYKAIFHEEVTIRTINQIKEGIDLTAFFSSNTALYFHTLLEKHGLIETIRNGKIAAIGDETANACKKLFGKVDIIAEPFTEEGLIESMEKYFAETLHATSLQEMNL